MDRNSGRIDRWTEARREQSIPKIYPKSLPRPFKFPSKIVENRRPNGPKSRSGGGLGGSRSVSGRLGRVLGRFVNVLRRCGCLLEPHWETPCARLGASWGCLGGVSGASQAVLGPGASWGVLERIGGVLGSIFVAKRGGTLRHFILEATIKQNFVRICIQKSTLDL